jgi:uncharacterized repeat protein (TIGR03803 family)
MTKLNWMTKACGVFLLWAATAVALPAQTLTTLYSFDGTDGDGSYPGLIQGTDGNFYGVTPSGGGTNGYGTVFKITPSGTLTTLHVLRGTDGGASPQAGLVQGTDGNFYGTATDGGANGYGTVFEITPGGAFRTLYSFDGTDGAYPVAALIQGTNGDFYGTTSEGGNYSLCSNGCGTAFKISRGGTLTTLHSFDVTDGYYLAAGLVQGTDGNFYGATEYGGTNLLDNYGTVFKMTPSGALTTLHNFAGYPTDGAYTHAGLVQVSDGDYYGITLGGGANDDGTVFEIAPSGTLTTLFSFDLKDGVGSYGALVHGSTGGFYGTTTNGGTSNACDAGCGTVFEISSSGKLATLYNFCSLSGCTDGDTPYAGLVQGTDGNFYGITGGGGTFRYGTIFSLSVGLGPFVETQPVSGKVGAAVAILGTSLTGATSVSFNGTIATFTVVSSSEITTTVPTGATTGTVRVVTPNGGTLSSNVPFTVRP